MKTFLTGFFFVWSLSAYPGTVDTINIPSKVMKKEFRCVVVKPNAYKKKKNRFPVVYLLHGYSGEFSNWIKKMPALKEEVDKLQLIIVCPEGGYSSWYFDSPVDSSTRYETYVAVEVPEFIDAHYRTVNSRKARAITGLSMGGHGAFFLAFRHADFFGACGSMSGLTDLNDTRQKYDLAKRIGDTVKFANNWKNYSVINVVETRPADSLAIIFDCGVDDPFYGGNKKMHEKMVRLKIPHDYTERAGGHNWPYWINSVQYQLLFFRKYFDVTAKDLRDK
jgi:S-formylglutathione hydrolase FrmB